MIVVDTNIIGYLLIPGQFSASAEAVLRRDPDWHAPILWRSEFRNVLARYVRVGELALERALAIIEQAETLMQGAEHDVKSPDVLRLAASSGRQAYDCEFIALADDLNVVLVTCDDRLSTSFPARAKSPDEFLKA